MDPTTTPGIRRRRTAGRLARLLPLGGLVAAGAAAVLTQATPAASSGEPAAVYCRLADGFDYPVGKPDGAGYYKARGFWPNGHLGEDWNGRGGGNTDLGDPVYSVGDGVVVLSEDVRVGWGNVVIVRHAYREGGQIRFVDALYGHLDRRMVRKFQVVRRGEQVGTIGTNRGMYYAHLHFEIRRNIRIGMNRTKFARDFSNYYSPTPFIQARRRLLSSPRKYSIPISTFAPYGEELPERSDRARPKGESIVPVRGDEEPGTGESGGLEPELERILEETEPAPAEGQEDMESFWQRLREKFRPAKR